MKPVHFACIWLMLVSTLALAQNPVPFVSQPLVRDAVAPGGPALILTVTVRDSSPERWQGFAPSLTSGTPESASTGFSFGGCTRVPDSNRCMIP